MPLKTHMDEQPSLNMTPMIDIVFLLIIFFMTVSQVSKVNKERLQLPIQAGSDEQKPAVVTVNVNDVGDVIVSGRLVNVPQLVGLVGDELARVGNDPSRVNVVLRADARGNSQTVNEIVTALAQLEVTRIRIAVEVPQ